MRFYWVEDNPLILENLRSALHDIPQAQWAGHSSSETVALHWLHHNLQAWDAVVIDLFLKTGTGLGVLSSISAHYPMKQILVLSNYVGHEIRQQCLRLGAQAVFDKTQEIEAFFAFLRQRVTAQAST